MKTKEKIIGKLYEYNNGSSLVEFVADTASHDYYVWSPARSCRLATYRSVARLHEALADSDNSDGGYGCALLAL